MNKKISTLMAGGFLLTSVFASAQVELTPEQLKIADVATLQKGGTFYIVESADNEIDASDRVYVSTVDPNDEEKVVYTSYDFSTFKKDDNGKYGNAYAWKDLQWVLGVDSIKNGSAGQSQTTNYYYSLKNVGTGSFITGAINKTASPNPTVEGVILDALTTPVYGGKAFNGDPVTGAKANWYSYFCLNDNEDLSEKITQGQPFYLYYGEGALVTHILQATSDGKGLTFSSGSKTKHLYFCVLDKTVADLDAIDAMNQTVAGEGFGLSFSGIEKYEANPFATTKKFKALVVKNDIKKDMGNNIVHIIPEGVYLAVEYPQTANTNNNIIATWEEFQQCSFLAVDPFTNKEINDMDRDEGYGYEFKVVSASEMNYVEDIKLDQANISNEIYVGNACLEVVITNILAKNLTYEFNLKGFRAVVDGKLTEFTDKSIGTVTSEGKSYIVTNDKAAAFSLTNNSVKKVKELLNTEDVPTVYTIQFVSGQDKDENSEYGQYLTVGKYETTPGFELYSTTDENVSNDPLYQFVITSVDSVKNEATFANRQTGAELKAVFYAEGEDVYTIYPTNRYYFYRSEIDEKDNTTINFESESIAAKQVKLTKINITDQFATFDAADNLDGLAHFELARTSVADGKFYVYARRNANDKLITTGTNSRLAASEETVDQFELIKVKDGKKDLVEVVEFPYVYNKDGVAATSLKRDTVAYNNYKIKLFAPDETEDYFVDGNASLVQTNEANATAFVIKTNLDGSVTLIVADNNTANIDKASEFSNVGTKYYQVGGSVGTATNKDADAWTSADYYEWASSLNQVKTFMVGEPEAISLEAVPQHLSFERNDNNGFISMNADKDGIISRADAEIEDVTLWVDTVKSDESVPSFYITKGGNFLYYATDSATSALTNKDKYIIPDNNDENYKLIFKAGELISSDTLVTMVDGKEVKVAEKAEAGNTVKGGLNHFQFQIIKDEEGSDEYVIRQTGTYSYVRVINGLLTLDASKKAAARFFIEKQSAPTANDDITTSEVKVIAGNGQITIAGAAGKKVVVSNILGQVVANTVITSDNATIAAPQGIVVVAVEGEEAVKAIVK